MLGHTPAGLLHVVDRNVLEKARERIEPHTALLVDVGEAHAATRRVRPTGTRKRETRIEHDAQSAV